MGNKQDRVPLTLLKTRLWASSDAAKRVTRQNRAVVWVIASGGSVEYDYEIDIDGEFACEAVRVELLHVRSAFRCVQKEKLNMPNPVVHFEIGGRESEATRKFYAELFGWKIEMAGPAAMISTGSDEGIQGHITALGHEPFNYVTVYVQVEDLQAYLDKAKSLGGETLIPPTDVPGMGAFAWFTDIDGNTIGLWKPIQASA